MAPEGEVKWGLLNRLYGYDLNRRDRSWRDDLSSDSSYFLKKAL